MDPLSLLGRKDKWFLAGGKGALYAPPFPRHLLAPGFWDECYLADIRLSRLFTALFVDPRGRSVRFESRVLEWRPDRLILLHQSTDFVVREIRTVTEGNAWVSELQLVNGSSPVNVFLWSLPNLQPVQIASPWNSLTDVQVHEDAFELRYSTAWPADLVPDRSAVEAENLKAAGQLLDPVHVYLALGANRERQSWTVNLAQRHDDAPLFELSILPEKFSQGRLPGEFKLNVGPEPHEGMVHLVQHYTLDDRGPLILACGSGLTPRAARHSFEDARREGVIERSEVAWRTYFAGVPQFASSDPFLTNAYWYRWYGLRLNTVDLPGLPVRSEGASTFAPFVTEGIGFFRNFVTYSAQAHLREVSWMRDPALAVGILDNLDRVQRADGSFPGHNYSGRPSRDFYHAEFATGAAQLEALHPDSLAREHVGALRRYADYLVRHRTRAKDPQALALYDIFDQNETGQEYMSRYAFANASLDEWASFRVSGVDATVYAALLFEFLSKYRLGDSGYRALRDAALLALSERSWDAEASFFCDVDLEGRRSPARPATGLYALNVLAGSIAAEKVVNRWLANSEEFWLPFGFPATAHSDETFSAEGEWRDKRLNCPWNGRSWPMANSHLVDAFAAVARSSDSTDLRRRAGAALLKAVRLMFHDRDASRPNSYEHYDPITGTPALYRGYDDYMHSWIVDLILRHAAGVRPEDPRGTRDPLILEGVQFVECELV